MQRFTVIRGIIIVLGCALIFSCTSDRDTASNLREHISINEDWLFYKYDSTEIADNLIYDNRPEISENNEYIVADAKPTEAINSHDADNVLKPWVLPAANDFIADPVNHHIRPQGDPSVDFPFVQNNFDDSGWKKINLPHDWAINGPFYEGFYPEVGGGMGRLPIHGVAWYRKKLDIPASDAGKSFFLDIDGAMSYAMVWCNGKLVGGWPYGYASWRLNLTPYMVPGEENQLAIRLDNPNYSARWYPGGGIYRNVWLVKTNPVHVGHWGTYFTSKDISKTDATINQEVVIENDSKTDVEIVVTSEIYELDENGAKSKKSVANFPSEKVKIDAGSRAKVNDFIKLNNPKRWGPKPTQTPNLYLAVTTLIQNGKKIDNYETKFGIRDVEFDPGNGVLINGEKIKLQGVNQHHDLGALGAAFNVRAAERQLEILREMGCNAIRMSHNPPAPELLELTDRMGFLVIDEIFDSWERKKTPYDFHLIFKDWSEPDTRAFVRRDRNNPSVIAWSVGNEVGEQYTSEDGAAVAKRLNDFVKEEDPSRPTITAMNFAKPFMEFPKVADLIGLNYQGEGIRQDSIFEGTDRIRTAPQYDAFHEMFPGKTIISTETASAFSSRGVYLFPVTEAVSSPVRDGSGGDSNTGQVSSYELYAVDFGSSADKVFASLDRHPFVAGEFVWTGWDYLGEPTPYYQARSSYTGIIDLAGFRKDRFYLYQSRWRPDFPMVHILPHWNWPERVGKVTPVHVFTSGDEVELFLNGKSLGRKKKQQYEYRLRWDNVLYEPGELKAISYKKGEKWAEEIVKTTRKAKKIHVIADRRKIVADGKDLSFVTVEITDEEGLSVPRSNNRISFYFEGPGKIVATDNGDPMNMESFSSHERNAFNGKVLAIICSQAGKSGTIKLKAQSPGLQEATIEIQSK